MLHLSKSWAIFSFLESSQLCWDQPVSQYHSIRKQNILPSFKFVLGKLRGFERYDGYHKTDLFSKLLGAFLDPNTGIFLHIHSVIYVDLIIHYL